MKTKTIVKPCTCTHEFQDQQYGKQNRVMNIVGKGEQGTSTGDYRCTVCKKVHKIK